VVYRVGVSQARSGEYDGPMANQYMYVFGPADRPLREDPSAWTSQDERTASEHYLRLRQATIDGTVILAGRPLGDEGPAVVIFDAESEDDARRFMEADPFVAEGLFTAELYPFSAALVRGEVTG